MSDAQATSGNLPSTDTGDPEELARYRFRRWMFVLCITLLSMLLAFLLAWAKTGSVVEHAVDGFSGIAETIVVTYLGTSVVDRSNILSSLGARIKSGPIGNVLSAQATADGAQK